MNYDGPYYPKMSKEKIEQLVKEYKNYIRGGNWPNPRKRMVIANKETQELTGTVSWYWQNEETNWKSIGLAIYDDKNWGKSIGYEALKLWIDYLFKEDKDIVRLDLRTWEGNIGMLKLAEKSGFKEEARFRKALIVKNKYYDSIGLGILKEEWKEKRQTHNK